MIKLDKNSNLVWSYTASRVPHHDMEVLIPAYLDEYVFRFNRRQTTVAAFQTLLGIASNKEPVSFAQLSS